MGLEAGMTTAQRDPDQVTAPRFPHDTPVGMAERDRFVRNAVGTGEGVHVREPRRGGLTEAELFDAYRNTRNTRREE